MFSPPPSPLPVTSNPIFDWRSGLKGPSVGDRGEENWFSAEPQYLMPAVSADNELRRAHESLPPRLVAQHPSLPLLADPDVSNHVYEVWRDWVAMRKQRQFSAKHISMFQLKLSACVFFYRKRAWQSLSVLPSIQEEVEMDDESDIYMIDESFAASENDGSEDLPMDVDESVELRAMQYCEDAKAITYRISLCPEACFLSTPQRTACGLDRSDVSLSMDLRKRCADISVEGDRPKKRRRIVGVVAMSKAT
ncbi:hypothetical protein NM688_g5211 [Phlebia brevispora]|uniref:Uncharacterized protein n=1 Tax=Phlebia brevispora TaxID=194682 RepID=A0ACC1SZG5_9APHY|nr:hypothetical protein NM688_g5211 [Phlebia brevispora]